MDDDGPPFSPRSILGLSVIMYLVSCGIALGGAWLTGVRLPVGHRPALAEFGAGLILTLPLFAGLLAVRHAPWPWARELWTRPQELLGPAIARMNFLELLLVAAMAGVGEELLFRGFLQAWLSETSVLAGLIVPNLLFGLLHWVTPAYAGGAFVVGLYLGSALRWGPSTTVVSLMTAHTVYDLVALYWLARTTRQLESSRESGRPSPR